MKGIAIRAALACGVVAVALATVTFEPKTGTGFIGKGDVQQALGLNNAQIQDKVATGLITFTYVQTDTYNVVTAWATGNVNNPVSVNYHTATVTTVNTLNNTVAFDPRQTNGQKQFTGFNLMGIKSTTSDGNIPAVSPVVQYVTYSWDTRDWDGTYDTVPNPNYNGKNSPTIQVKHYVTVTHTTDQLPAHYDAAGNLVPYSEGNDKAVLSVSLTSSLGSLKVNGVDLMNYSF